jgi:lipopolysaccharide transport system ATP-binding protein
MSPDVTDVAIKVDGLGKKYKLSHREDAAEPDTAAGALAETLKRLISRGGTTREEFWALRDVSFEVPSGQTLGIVGSNGAGKSTLLSLLSGVTEPSEGRAVLQGRVGALLEVGTGFHPDLTGRDNVYLNGAILGMTRREIEQRFDEIVEFSGVRKFLDTQVKHYSSGMYVRLAFSIAAHLDPDILLVDEVLSVGDQAFQDKCLGRLRESTESGRTVIFISHNMSSITSLCERGLYVRKGRIAFDGPIERTIETYLTSQHRLEGSGSLEGVERDGSGAIRFAEVTISNAEGSSEIYPDREVVVRLRFSAREKVAGHLLNLGLGINTILGQRLVTLYTRFDPAQQLKSIEVEDGTEIECRLPELPLRPGRYFMTLYLDQTGGELLDRVQNQVEFEILSADYFGTGQLPSDSQGDLMLRHHWRAPRPVRLPMEVSLP